MHSLFLLVVLELCLLVWLHLNALEKNLQSLQRHLVSLPASKEGVWVEAERVPYSFRICQICVERLLHS